MFFSFVQAMTYSAKTMEMTIKETDIEEAEKLMDDVQKARDSVEVFNHALAKLLRKDNVQVQG